MLYPIVYLKHCCLGSLCTIASYIAVTLFTNNSSLHYIGINKYRFISCIVSFVIISFDLNIPLIEVITAEITHLSYCSC